MLRLFIKPWLTLYKIRKPALMTQSTVASTLSNLSYHPVYLIVFITLKLSYLCITSLTINT